MERLVKVIDVERYGMFDTVIQFTGEDIDTGEAVLFAADHRPAQDIIEALAVGEEPVAVVPDFAITRVVTV